MTTDRHPGPAVPDLDVAATLECSAELLPYLPELLSDHDSLGSDPGTVIAMLERNVSADAIGSVLDLCCGKGATAIALASRFDCRVAGIDAIAPFVASARTAARDAGVGDRCRFEIGKLEEAVTRDTAFDLVVFSAVGPILGGITATVRHVTSPLRDGGHLVIEDSFLLPDAPRRAGFEQHRGLDETRRRIEAAGVDIVEHRVAALEEPLPGDEEHERLTARAEAVARKRPDLRAALDAYLARQWDERVYLARWTHDVTWLLRSRPARQGRNR